MQEIQKIFARHAKPFHSFIFEGTFFLLSYVMLFVLHPFLIMRGGNQLDIVSFVFAAPRALHHPVAASYIHRNRTRRPVQCSGSIACVA
jgi:hypothetical protein